MFCNSKTANSFLFFFPGATMDFLKKIFICLFIYVTMPGLSCGMWDLVP